MNEIKTKRTMKTIELTDEQLEEIESWINEAKRAKEKARKVKINDAFGFAKLKMWDGESDDPVNSAPVFGITIKNIISGKETEVIVEKSQALKMIIFLTKMLKIKQ